MKDDFGPAYEGSGAKARIADPAIRAAIEGPYHGYKCLNDLGATQLDKAARELGAFSILYQGRFVVISSSGQPYQDFFDWVNEATKDWAEGPKYLAREDRLADALDAIVRNEGLAIFPKRPEYGTRACQFCHIMQPIRPNGTFERHNVGSVYDDEEVCDGSLKHYTEAPTKGQTEEGRDG